RSNSSARSEDLATASRAEAGAKTEIHPRSKVAMSRRTGGDNLGSSGGRRGDKNSPVLVNSADLIEMEDKSDWTRVDALTDAEVDQAIAEDPDAAPVLSDAFWRHSKVL